jgi:hypothetical protein
MIVAQATYEPTDPTVDSQIATLKGFAPFWPPSRKGSRKSRSGRYSSLWGKPNVDPRRHVGGDPSHCFVAAHNRFVHEKGPVALCTSV